MSTIRPVTFRIEPIAPIAKLGDRPPQSRRERKNQPKAQPVYDPKDLIPWQKRAGKQCKACPDNRPPGYANCGVALPKHIQSRFGGASHGSVCTDCAMRWDRW